MKIKKIWFYVAGIAIGVALAATISLWAEASTAYRCVFLVLLALLFFATWSKRKPYKSNSPTNSKPLNALVCEGSHEDDNNTNKGND